MCGSASTSWSEGVTIGQVLYRRGSIVTNQSRRRLWPQANPPESCARYEFVAMRHLPEILILGLFPFRSGQPAPRHVVPGPSSSRVRLLRGFCHGGRWSPEDRRPDGSYILKVSITILWEETVLHVETPTSDGKSLFLDGSDRRFAGRVKCVLTYSGTSAFSAQECAPLQTKTGFNSSGSSLSLRLRHFPRV